MKKFILTLFVAVFALMTYAQTVTFSPLPVNFTKFTTATDYNVTNTTARLFIIEAAKENPCTQDFYVNLDSVSGNHTNVAVALYGAKFADTAYSQIGSTINWKGTTADTTIVISNATATRYNFYKWTVTGTGTGVTKVDTQILKLYLEK